MLFKNCFIKIFGKKLCTSFKRNKYYKNYNYKKKKKIKQINTQKLEIKKVIELLKSHEKLEKLVGKFVYLQFLLQIYGNVCFLCLPTPLI